MCQKGSQSRNGVPKKVRSSMDQGKLKRSILRVIRRFEVEAVTQSISSVLGSNVSV